MKLTGLKRSAATFLVPDPTAHLQMSFGVHVLRGQTCFGSKGGPSQSSVSGYIMAESLYNDIHPATVGVFC